MGDGGAGGYYGMERSARGEAGGDGWRDEESLGFSALYGSAELVLTPGGDEEHKDGAY